MSITLRVLSNEFINLAYNFIGNYSMLTLKKNALYLQSKFFTLPTDLEREVISQLGI